VLPPNVVSNSACSVIGMRVCFPDFKQVWRGDHLMMCNHHVDSSFVMASIVTQVRVGVRTGGGSVVQFHVESSV
jgi:hypothetical protein